LSNSLSSGVISTVLFSSNQVSMGGLYPSCPKYLGSSISSCTFGFNTISSSSIGPAASTSACAKSICFFSSATISSLFLTSSPISCIDEPITFGAVFVLTFFSQ